MHNIIGLWSSIRIHCGETWFLAFLCFNSILFFLQLYDFLLFRTHTILTFGIKAKESQSGFVPVQIWLYFFFVKKTKRNDFYIHHIMITTLTIISLKVSKSSFTTWKPITFALFHSAFTFIELFLLFFFSFLLGLNRIFIKHFFVVRWFCCHWNCFHLFRSFVR